MEKYYNPFQNHEIRCPKEYHDQITKYTQTKSLDGRKTNPDQSPFPRMVDIWLLAMCFGIRKEKRVPLTIDSVKLVEGTIFSSDPWRVEVMSLIAIALNENTDVLNKPGEIILMANEYAAAGYQDVFNLLEEGHGDPIWNISTQLLNIL